MQGRVLFRRKSDHFRALGTPTRSHERCGQVGGGRVEFSPGRQAVGCGLSHAGVKATGLHTGARGLHRRATWALAPQANALGSLSRDLILC